MNGIRTSKTVNNETTTYCVLKDKIFLETSNHKTILYHYAANRIIGFTYNNIEYFYERDLQGNIVRIYRKDNLAIVAEYTYDAYGNHVVSNFSEANIGDINPIRYRGYYFDVETGFYYLNSRYYNPQTARFLTPDSLSILNETKSQINGLNLYSYCGNDPVNDSDGSGHMAVALALLILGGIGAVAGFASQSISDAVTGKGFDWGRSGIAAAAGFLGGLCYAIPGVGGYVGAAVSSGLNAIGQMAYSGESYSFDDYAIVGLTSAGIGVLSSWAFGKLTSGISYFADAGYFLEHFMEFAGDAGGIVLKNSVILQLSGQLLVRNTVSTIVNDVFNSAMLLNRGADYFLRYYRYRQSGMNPWEAFWYGMSY